MKKASGVDVLLTAAFGGVAGIITGKSWTNLPSHHDSAAPGFLPELRQDVPGAERVLGGRQRAPGWEALGGLPDQSHSSSFAVTACTERRRVPTPTGQPQGDDALAISLRPGT